MLSLRQTITFDAVLRGAFFLMLLPLGAFLGWAVAHQFWIAAAAVLFVPFYFVWPVEVSLGAFAFLVPFEEVAMLGNSKSATLPFLAGAVAGAGLLAVGLIHRRFEKPPRSAKWWTLFVALAVASYLWAYSPPAVLALLPGLLGLLLVYLTAVSIRISEKELFWIVTLAIAGGVLASFFSMDAFYHGQTFARDARSTMIQGSREADPNYYALGLLLPLSLAVGRVLSSRNVFQKAIMVAAAMIMTLAVLLTMSRGALLAAILMIVVYSVRYRLNWRIAAPVAMLAGAMSFVPELFFARLQQAVESGGAGRLDIWTAGVHALPRFGLFGGGFNNFPSLFWLFAGYAPTFRGYDRDAHNMYLATAVELGVAGVVFMAAAIISQLRDARPPKTNDASIRLMAVPAEAACWAVLLASFFLNPITRKTLWLAFIMLALSVKARQARQAREEARRGADNGETAVATEGRITTAALATGPFATDWTRQ